MKAHDIRHLGFCHACMGLGDNREMLNVKMHGKCMFETFGIKAILKLPEAEQNKLSLADIGPVAMKLLCDHAAKTRAKGSRA